MLSSREERRSSIGTLDVLLFGNTTNTNNFRRYLVVATGSVWEGPLAALTGKKENLIDSVNVWREKFKKSKAVVIVGAGSAGLGTFLTDVEVSYLPLLCIV